MLCMLSVWAYDFEIDGIYYNIIKDKTNEVEVTFKGQKFNSYDNEYTGSVNVPEKITYEGNEYNVTTIGEYAFCECDSLISVSLPKTTTTIKEDAFAKCTSISTITIPENVCTIGESAFGHCSNLSTIYYNAIMCNDLSQKGKNRKITPFLYVGNRNKDGLQYENGTGGFDVIIGSKVRRIPAYMFSNEYIHWFYIGGSTVVLSSKATCLVKVNNVIFMEHSECTEIGEKAFYGDSITSINLPPTIKTIGSNTFAYCDRIDSITIPQLVESCGYGAFNGCTGLMTVNWDAIHCNTLYAYPFSGRVEQLTIGDKVEYIPDYLYSGLSNIDTIIIPNNVKEMGNYVFEYCNAEVIQLPSQLKSIGDYAFYNCYNLFNIDIPETVETIGVSAFENCMSLYDINIPDNVKSIGERCFAYTSISNANLGNGLTLIPESTFYSCYYLTVLTLGKSIKTIKDYAFWGCEFLETIYNHRERPGNMYSTSFDGVDKFSCKLYVPSSSVEMYKSAAGWRDFYDVIAMDETTTNINTELADINSKFRKIFIDGQLLIQSNEGAYNIIGQEIK